MPKVLLTFSSERMFIVDSLDYRTTGSPAAPSYGPPAPPAGIDTGPGSDNDFGHCARRGRGASN